MPLSQNEPAEAPAPLLLDATVLNNFIKIGRFALLRLLFPSSLRASAQVYEEMRAGGLSAPLRDAVAEGWLQVVTPESGPEVTLYTEYARSLGPGEAASLAVAVCRRWTFATDDRAARAAARAAAIPLTGSVGFLCLAVRIGAISRDQGDHLLAEMKRHGYWFPFETLEGLV